MSYLARQIEEHSRCSNPNERIVIYKTGSHLGYLTYDGIDVNGKRITDEIIYETGRLNLGEGKVVKISIIGYSMGGLVARYAMGVLYHMGYFDNIEPVHYVSFCTPHVGARNPKMTLSSRIFNFIAPYVVAHTGQQMWLKDRRVLGNKVYYPLLQWMADPLSKFYMALKLFKNRTLYANTINDRRTSWYTTSISNLDPFYSMVNESLSAYDFEYIDGYEPNLIDFTKPITFKSVEKLKPLTMTFQKFLFKTYTWTKVILKLMVAAPLYLVYLLCIAIYQRIRLLGRIKHFHRHEADGLLALYDGSQEEGYDLEESQSQLRFDEAVSDQAETFVDSIFQAVNSANYFDYQHSITTRSLSISGTPETEKSELIGQKTKLVNLKGKEVTDEFKLRLLDSQQEIISSLNNLKWDKYPVIIRDTKLTHAAVIYRHPDPSFREGINVVRHFIEQVFQV